MGQLVWLAIPALASALAALWVGWSARPRRRAQVQQTALRYQRFNAAFTEHSRRPTAEPLDGS